MELTIRRATREDLVHRDHRDQGVGRQLVARAIEEAKARRAGIVRLTSHTSRENAHRFYERLGFTAEHIGMKLELA
ncbi:GNAT family N-acetyltransferase [Lentzea tibetensis]|uniref:GNAT family N-acetyltransferase n=1 Tax=Lentzea tibetensis TaxID=2591470 RepID=A0A563EGR3_9PSEU|nr:GNAT family N-acetyltransferase [Lentzea tibetensis]TWP45427.1 GNAT family N-acetyltransferase [Lentzea tibetensis]